MRTTAAVRPTSRSSTLDRQASAVGRRNATAMAPPVARLSGESAHWRAMGSSRSRTSPTLCCSRSVTLLPLLLRFSDVGHDAPGVAGEDDGQGGGVRALEDLAQTVVAGGHRDERPGDALGLVVGHDGDLRALLVARGQDLVEDVGGAEDESLHALVADWRRAGRENVLGLDGDVLDRPTPRRARGGTRGLVRLPGGADRQIGDGGHRPTRRRKSGRLSALPPRRPACWALVIGRGALRRLDGAFFVALVAFSAL